MATFTQGCSVFGCGEQKPCRFHGRRVRNDTAAKLTTTDRGYGWWWQQYRERWLKAHPFCGDRLHGSSAEHSLCVSEGRVVGAGMRKMVVDHIVPFHGANDPLAKDPANHQTLCESCHNRKTVTEDGGFVRRIPGERFVVTGPAGSGKTMWVEKRARPGDIVFDLDAIAAVMTRVPRFPRPQDATKALLVMRDALIDWLERAVVLVHTFLIVTDPTQAQEIATRINAQLIDCGRIANAR